MKGWVIRGVTVCFTLGVMLIVYLADKNVLPDIVGQLWRIPGGDKIGHFMLVGVLGMLVSLSLRVKQWKLGRWSVLYGGSIVAVLITFEEFSQIWIPHRTFDLLDLASNYGGILFFGVVARSLGRLWWPADELDR